jgi:hypothetical protein
MLGMLELGDEPAPADQAAGAADTSNAATTNGTP